MTLTYGGYNIADYTSKYGVSVVPRTVEGPNAIDSIAGTHEPDPLAQKRDNTVTCRDILTDDQMNTLWTMAANAVDVPYQDLLYVSGNITISGKYRISVGQSTPMIDTSERKLFGGVVLTFTQR